MLQCNGAPSRSRDCRMPNDSLFVYWGLRARQRQRPVCAHNDRFSRTTDSHRQKPIFFAVGDPVGSVHNATEIGGNWRNTC